ncbi:MAG: cadherin repeat domain-containing protein, partial [Planctomycetota bacterium]|nr:cadherin repeat domain-containing protein [Planctomycetota bacterium]
MSPASHGVGRLHRLYGIVLGKRRGANERFIEPLTPYVFVEPMEPRMLLSGFTPADLSALPYREGLGYQVSADCFYNPPASGAASGQAGLAAAPPAGQRPFGATADDTSEYMAGDVYVTVVLLQSNGAIDPSTQTWTAGEIANVKNEINEGLTWWQTTYANTSYTGSLHFTADFTYANTPFRTSYEPITHSTNDQNLWIDQFLAAQGNGSGEAGQRAFDDAQRLAHNADWAYTVFVVDSSGTADGTFMDGYFAYAYLGGPIAVMTYDNGGWGIDKMGQVFAHESAHIFYALDEYYQPGYGGSSYNDYSGYYNTQNTNGAMDRPGSAGPQQNSLMGDETLQNAAYAAHTSSTPSLEMIGWKDSDGDNIIDVLDYPMTLTGSGSYSQGQRNYTFTGTSSVQTLGNLNPNGLAHGTTLNEIDGVQYSIDNGPWLDTQAQYGTTTATIDVTIGPLPMSTTHLAFRTISRESGAVSTVFSDSFTPPGAPTNVSPANHATDINLVPTLAIAPISSSNGGVSLAARWLLWRASDSVTVFDSGIDSVNTTSCPVPPDTLEFATPYSWIVRYQGNSGLWSGYSAVTIFTTMAKPSTASDKPVNIAPPDKATRASTTPTLSASTFHDPAGHTFVAARWIVRKTSDNSVVYDLQTPAVDGFSLTLPPGALAYATNYSWSVMYLDTGNEWGDPSNPTTFTTRKGPPVMLDQGLSVPENSPNGSVVGVVRAWSPDLGLTLQYAIIGGNTGNAFT